MELVPLPAARSALLRRLQTELHDSLASSGDPRCLLDTLIGNSLGSHRWATWLGRLFHSWYCIRYYQCVLVVLDSSVLVAGFRSRRGASFRTLELLRGGRFQIAMSVPLALEYEAVLVRQARELRLSRTEAIGLVDSLCDIACRQHVHFLWRPTLRDPHDEFILELAVASASQAIVTHNVRGFRGVEAFRIPIVTPAAFLRLIEEES